MDCAFFLVIFNWGKEGESCIKYNCWFFKRVCKGERGKGVERVDIIMIDYRKYLYKKGRNVWGWGGG